MRKTLPRLLFGVLVLTVPLAARADPVSVFIAAEAAWGAAVAGSVATAYSAALTFAAKYGLAALGIASPCTGGASARRDARREARAA